MPPSPNSRVKSGASNLSFVVALSPGATVVASPGTVVTSSTWVDAIGGVDVAWDPAGAPPQATISIKMEVATDFTRETVDGLWFIESKGAGYPPRPGIVVHFAPRV